MKISRDESGMFCFRSFQQINIFHDCELCGMGLTPEYSYMMKKLGKFIHNRKMCCLCWLYKNADTFAVKNYGIFMKYIVDGKEYVYAKDYVVLWLKYRHFPIPSKESECIYLKGGERYGKD